MRKKATAQPTATVEIIPESVKRELADLIEQKKSLQAQLDQQEDPAVMKFSAHFEALKSSLNLMVEALGEMKPENRERYRKGASYMLDEVKKIL